MAGEAVVFWLCGAGALSGFIIKVLSELYVAGIV